MCGHSQPFKTNKQTNRAYLLIKPHCAVGCCRAQRQPRKSEDYKLSSTVALKTGVFLHLSLMAQLSWCKPFHFKWRAALWVIKSSQCVSIWSSLQSYQQGYIILLNWEQLPEMESKGFSSLQGCESSGTPHLHKSLYIYLLSLILLASNIKMSRDLSALLLGSDSAMPPCCFRLLLILTLTLFHGILSALEKKYANQISRFQALYFFS